MRKGFIAIDLAVASALAVLMGVVISTVSQTQDLRGIAIVDETGLCFDGIDNDNDGTTDCNDPECGGGECYSVYFEEFPETCYECDTASGTCQTHDNIYGEDCAYSDSLEIHLIN